MKNEATLNNSATDWERIDAMQDEEIDLNDSPELTPEMFARAIVRRGLKPQPKKVSFTLWLEEDVLIWFRSQGAGYQAQMNDLLRAHMEAQTQQSHPPMTAEMSRDVVPQPNAATRRNPKRKQEPVG